MSEPKMPMGDCIGGEVPAEPVESSESPRRIYCLTPMLDAWLRSVDSIEPIRSIDSPQTILAADFKAGALPIRGGWGYSMDSACVIDKDHPVAGTPFDYVAVEYAFVEKRIYEEMIIFRTKETQFANIDWRLSHQEMYTEDGRVYDRLEFHITAIPQADWDLLGMDCEGPSDSEESSFDESAYRVARERATVSLIRDFWFDITGAM